jgi:DNA topoisomerase-1
VESPTKANTLSRFLGSGYEVEATRGHIKDLPKSKLGVDVEHDFKPEYLEVPKQKLVIENLKKISKNAENVFLASDPDREGEAIAQHIKEVIGGNKKVKRIVFHEITKEAVEEAIKNPRDIDENLVNAQISRRVLDRLVGYNLSPLLWRKVRRGLSAGRVQSVALRLIVEREREIGNFNPEEYWEIYCKVKIKEPKVKNVSRSSKVEEFAVQLTRINGKKAEIHDGKAAKEIVGDLEKSDYTIFDVSKREVRKYPYPPYTTSTMSQAGANVFGWTSRKTMQIAQRLYEQGLITYHRTDSTNISNQAVIKLRSYIEKKYGLKYVPEKPRFYKIKSKVVQEAHEAIRPTELDGRLIQSAKFGDDEKRLYELIWKRFVACQMSESVYDETTITVIAKGKRQGTKTYELRVSGRVMKFDGWRAVYGGEAKPGVSDSRRTLNSKDSIFKTEDGEVILPDVKKGEMLQLVKVDSLRKFTSPPPRYNEASLIKILEKIGIGRPSTYAPIISTIRTRSYVEKNDGKFFPTNVGIAVNDFIFKNFPEIVDYSFTADMEDKLDDIANGKKDWVKIMKAFWKPFHKKLEDVGENAGRVRIETEKLNKKCPECEDGELVIRIGRFGKFISCSRFPDCKYTEKYVQKVDMKCPDCKTGDVIIKKTKAGRSFYGCSRYPGCKWASWKKPEN